MRFLSDEWVEALDRTAQTLPPPRSSGPPVVIQQTVTGTSQGDVSYQIVLGPEGCRVQPGRGLDPTVSLVTDLECAERTARGEAAALQAVLDGRIHIEGDVGRLPEIMDVLTQLDGAFASVRARTEW